MQSKDYSRRGKGREGGGTGGRDNGGGRGGGSGRGRSNEEYLPSGRGGGMMGGGGGGPPRGQNFPPRNNSGPPEAAVPVPRSDVKPPEFNMKTNDFPALPGSMATGPARGQEDRAFLEVVKGTGKLRLEDGEEVEGEEEAEMSSQPTEIPEDSSHKQSIVRYYFVIISAGGGCKKILYPMRSLFFYVYGNG